MSLMWWTYQPRHMFTLARIYADSRWALSFYGIGFGDWAITLIRRRPAAPPASGTGEEW